MYNFSAMCRYFRVLFFCLTVLTLFYACENTVELIEQNFTVPSWTLYQRALLSGQSISEACTLLVLKEYPYNINVTINGDPTTQMGVSWFTNADVTGGIVQIVEGKTDEFTLFTKKIEIQAAEVLVDTVNYVSNGNNNEELLAATGFEKGEKRSYRSNKVLINNLKPNTTYSYRVGKKGYWSEIGTFTTAKDNKEAFEFIYVTDTQANTDEMFDISKKTIETAYRQIPDAKFLLITGDFVESSGTQSSEWEWEQWFEKMQNICLRLPVAPAQGNHDTSPFGNMFHHFNTDNSYNEQQTDDDARTAIGGTVYSFVYGDALFMVINYEDYRKGEPYFSALERWMRKQISNHSDVKWKIVAFHKSMFTGSNDHQSDADGRIVRERMAPVFQEMGINLVFQGHDHVYEVFGVLTAEKTENSIVYTHLPNAVSGQKQVVQTFADGTVDCNPSVSVTGKEGGTYDVSNGILYFLNNSAGKKKYYPRSKEQMEAAFPQHGVQNYFDFFNKFGQTGEPTFSRLKVSTEIIEITTYTVSESGDVAVFDTIRVVKK
jgi:3',5'-cyclic AMP phosphodiesterase CpdA